MTQELTKAAQQALEALEYLGDQSDHDVKPFCWTQAKASKARDALRAALTQRPAAQDDSDEAQVADYQEALASVDALVRRLDVALNGDAAASQARLCDIVSQVERQGLRPAAQEVGWRCPACGTHEVAVKLECHNSACRSYASAVTVHEGWKAPQQATPEPVGEPAAWRWFNSNGDQVTNWLDFKAAQKAKVEAQVAEAGGRIEYAYTRPAAAPAVPDAMTPPKEDGTEYDYSSGSAAGYAEGWNACREAMLAAAQAKGAQA